jgi:hypothetical protein
MAEQTSIAVGKQLIKSWVAVQRDHLRQHYGDRRIGTGLEYLPASYRQTKFSAVSGNRKTTASLAFDLLR